MKPLLGEPRLCPLMRHERPEGELWRVIHALILVMDGMKVHACSCACSVSCRCFSILRAGGKEGCSAAHSLSQGSRPCLRVRARVQLNLWRSVLPDPAHHHPDGWSYRGSLVLG